MTVMQSENILLGEAEDEQQPEQTKRKDLQDSIGKRLPNTRWLYSD
jgi:hypothetical protein